MNVELVQTPQLTPERKARWTELQRITENADSPFYAADFVCAAAAHCPGVEIAVLRDGDQDVGFFPFQRFGRSALPVAWRMNDFHGGVFQPGIDFDARKLLQACDLRSWRFDHLPATQRWFSKWHFLFADSPYVDLTGGFDAYLASARERSSTRLRTVLRKSRKMAKEVGPLRFEFDSPDVQVFETLLAWKTDQLRRSHERDHLQAPWVKGLLEDLWTQRRKECCGVLSSLYAGDRLAAAHFGIRNAQVLHWWITAYNEDLKPYSPGGVLLLRLLEHAGQIGIQRLDLGKGDEEYKRSFQSAVLRLAEGSVSHRPWRRGVDRLRYRLRDQLRSSWLHGASQFAKRCWDVIQIGRPRRQARHGVFDQ